MTDHVLTEQEWLDAYLEWAWELVKWAETNGCYD
jgi:hypothetical protein